ncbi:MAG: hypothetical protein AB8G11_19435 [Saprospiraceae bacterium]
MNNTILLRQLIVLTLVSIFVLFMQCTPTKSIDNLTTKTSTNWLKGEWEGVGYQLNSSGSWSIQLKVNDDRYSIAYPSLECSGNWQLQKESDMKLEFIETITKGTDKCVNKGRIVITKVDDNHVTFTYFSPYSGELEAFSTLIRKSHLDKLKMRT